MMMRISIGVPLLGIVLATWCGHDVIAQAVQKPVLNPALEPTQYLYRDWQVEDGLPQNSVFALQQTHDGYLWLGTQEGLVRFDGSHFAVYDKHVVDALASHAITVLLEDRSRALWMGTDHGGLARMQDGTFTFFTSADGLPPGGIRSLHEDRDGSLWVGTVGGGLSRFDGRTFTGYTVDDGLAGNVILAIDQDRDGTVWVGTNGGLSALRNGRIESYTTADGLPGNEVWSLHATDAGALWIGTDQGVTRLRGGTFISYPEVDRSCGGTVTDLINDRTGALWIATLETGVCRVIDRSVQVFNRETGLSHHQVRVLHEDREGNIWIGTDGGGINQLRQGKFAVYGTPEGLSDDVVFAVYEDRDGAIWMGTETGGLNRLHKGRIKHFGAEYGLSSAFILSIHQDRQGTLWVGTFDEGLCRLSGERFQCRGSGDGLASDFVRAIYEDSRGVLWVGTDAGLHRMDDGRTDLFTTDDGLKDESITSIIEDESGDLWIGTWNGLNHIRQDRIDSSAVGQPRISSPVMTLHEDADGVLWIGTWGGGLCRFSDGRTTCYDTDDGLFDDSVLQMVEDDDETLWLGSNRGISRIAKTQLEEYDRNEIDGLTPVVYDENDGLRSREANGGTQPAAMKSSDGRLWFATLRGAAMIDPSIMAENRIPPPIILQDVWINGERIPAASISTLPPDSRKFEFHYAGLSFASPEEVRYQFRLDPYEDDWVDAGTRREAFYTNLPAGEYTFRVRAANSDGRWSEQDATISFYLQPRVYQSIWFLVVCALALLAATVGAYHVRTRHLKARQRHLRRIVDERTQELQDRKMELETLNRNLEEEVQRQLDVFVEERVRYENELITARDRAEESAQLKANILSNVSHEIRTPLTAITGYAHILDEEVPEVHREFVGYISQNADRLLETLDSMLELSVLERGRKMDLQIEQVDMSAVVANVAEELAPAAVRKGLLLDVDGCAEPIYAEADAKALERVARKLVENAVKFTHDGEVRIAVGRRGRRVFFSVRDTGIGISENFMPHLFEAFKQESQGLNRSHEGSGLGLSVVRHLVTAMQGYIEVSSEPGIGSTFTVYLGAAESIANGRRESA